MKTATAIILSMFLVLASYAEIINVPDDHETIQGAIDVSEDGDTILVAPGEYVENINIQGSRTLGSLVLITGNNAYIDSTIIDGDQNGTVLTMGGNGNVVMGFTIRNGGHGGILVHSAGGQDNLSLLKHLLVTENSSEEQNMSGGIECYGVIIEDVSIDGNQGGDGGGIKINRTPGRDITTILRNVKVVNNTGMHGGGIFCMQADPELINVIVARNHATSDCGGIRCWGASPTLSNVTVVDNTEEMVNNSGLSILYGSNPVISNSIIWNNTTHMLSMDGGISSLNISYSDVEGGEEEISYLGREEDFNVDWHDSNIDENPQFTDPDNRDYHLTADSPCIDAGDPDADLDPDGTRADMGAFYFHQRDIEIDVEEFRFEPIEIGQVDSLPMTVRNVGNTLLTMDCEWSFHSFPSFTFENYEWIIENVEVEPLSDLTLWIYFHPNRTGGLMGGLRIQSDDPDESVILVNAFGGGLTDVEQNDDFHPVEFAITGAYPNPFNSQTTVKYSVDRVGETTLRAYNLAGQLVGTLFEGQTQIGRHQAVWDASTLPSGIYLMRLESAGRVQTYKVALVR